MPTKPDRRLDSWKEIAEYLGRDVTTAIRWERDKGLPVHRVPGGKRQAIFAHAEEIDLWLAGGVAKSPTEDLNQPNGQLLAPQGQASSASVAVALPSRRGSLLGWTAIGLVALGAGLLLGSSVRGLTKAPVVARVSLTGQHLTAWDETGSTLWTYQFPRRAFLPPDVQMSDVSYIGDLDGDGSQEILISVTFGPKAEIHEDELYCLSAGGELRWHLALHDDLVFGDEHFGPPWQSGRLVVYRAMGDTRIAWAQNHHTWWPSVLSVLDSRGQRISAFVNSGVILALKSIEAPAGPLLLAGGISNSNGAAMVAVLDGLNVVGSSPEVEGSAYECKSCSSGVPLRYLVLPPSELIAARGVPYNRAWQIHSLPNTVEVRTAEGPSEAGAEHIFQFFKDFALARAAFSDGYWALHRELERAGKIAHIDGSCSGRTAPATVRVWQPRLGWADLRPSSLARGD